MADKEFNKEGLRMFTGPDAEKEYFIVAPSAEHIRGADWEYSKTYTRSLVEGITTTAEMTDILMRRGVIGPEFEQRSNELAVELSKRIEKLESAETIDEKQEAAIEVAQSREELFQWNQRLNAPLANTCEQIADDSRLEFLTSCIVVDDQGQRVWANIDEYLREKEQGLAQKARFEVMLYLQGLNSDFLDQTPEAVAMREVEATALAAIKAELDKAAAEEEAAEEAEKVEAASKTKPKTTRKRTTKPKTTSKRTTKPRTTRSKKTDK